MYGCFCWLMVLVLTAALAYGFYMLAIKGGELALKRHEEERLTIINNARRKSGQKPLTMAELPPEARMPGADRRDNEPWDDDGRAKGFTVLPPTLPEAEPVASLEVPRAVASIVLLQLRHKPLTQPLLRAAVEKAWDVQLPENDPTATEFVVYAGPPAPGIISVGGFRFLVHNTEGPYFGPDNPLPGPIPDAEIDLAVAQSNASRQIDLLASDTGEPLSESLAYGLLGKLAVKLAGDQTLVVYIPEYRRFARFDRDSSAALQGDDVVGTLRGVTVI